MQSCGILDLDVEECAITALATSASKGLMGIAGHGFLYVREDWMERLKPAYVGRYSIERGQGHESEIEGHTYRLMPDARRFEAGNYNWAGIAAVNASLRELLEISTRRIEPHVVDLATALAEGLESMQERLRAMRGSRTSGVSPMRPRTESATSISPGITATVPRRSAP